ncbi:GerMN domain-containing protein [Paenibacillus sp. J2TS4]|uniref:GerMN domain-containing protein n=1 Tax=Paenibacillus sp. J2TS4 TaxID=2807194 RepID=UPI001B071E62|nr:GerMN domain-containing protein [Paenibacillus sp. J2TS4]GIP31312.1 spore germination protein GerM [Paenibacillus sp. J2TS4]
MAVSKGVRRIAMAGAIILLASGCSVNKPEESQSIDPPPISAEEMMLQIQDNEAGVSEIISETFRATLYFKDERGMVAPISLNLPREEGVAKKSLEYMVQGGPGEALLPQGFAALLPAGTKMTVDIDAETRVAAVDFSKEFTNYSKEDERKLLEAITWTLTGFPTVDEVKLSVRGTPLTEMPVDHTPINGALTRDMGINMEIANGVNIGRTTPVTLYFTKEGSDFSYYVPVTRLVERTDNVLQATVEELIKGPGESKGMTPVLSAAAQVLEVESSEESDLVTINFDSKLLDENGKAAVEAMESIVLSVTENTGASQVQILVDGEATVTTTNDQSYAKPVQRPSHVNAPKM